MKSIVFLFPIFLHIMTPLLRYTLSTMLFRVVLLLVETIMMLVAQTGTLYIPVCSVLPNILFVFFNLVSLNTSSETQGLLDGTMRYFRAKVYFKSWRAPENLFLTEPVTCRSGWIPTRWLSRKIFFCLPNASDMLCTALLQSVLLECQCVRCVFRARPELNTNLLLYGCVSQVPKSLRRKKVKRTSKLWQI